jgi:hypothetical protein
MANAWEQPDMIAAQALMHLEDALVITNLTATDKTSDFMTRPNGYAVGDTVRIKTRPEYSVNEFSSTIARQDIRESTRSMTIEKHFDVSVAVTSKEKVLDLDSFTSQVIVPAAYALAEKCDEYVGTKILNGAGVYSSATLFDSAADMAQARKTANLQQLETTGRFCLVDADLEAHLLGADWFGTWNERGPTGQVGRNEGFLSRTMGMEFYTSLNFPADSHTAGTGAATTNNGASDNMIGHSVLVYDGGTGTFEVGDRIYIAGVKRPLIVATQTTEIIPDDAAVTTAGGGAARGAIFDSRSMAVAMPILDAPSDKPAATTSNNGYSIRVVQGYDMDNKTETLSLDLLIGAEAYDPRRITVLRDSG